MNEAKKTHEPHEIVAAVKQAIVPKEDIDLSEILTFLRNSMKEKSPIELFNSLTNIPQGRTTQQLISLVECWSGDQEILVAEEVTPYTQALGK